VRCEQKKRSAVIFAEASCGKISHRRVLFLEKSVSKRLSGLLRRMAYAIIQE